MKKIISLFQRNYDTDYLVRNEVVPGAEWVIRGEGWPTRKWDGTCCLVQRELLFKRYVLKEGRKPPGDFIPCEAVDPKTGKQPGWRQVGTGPEDKWFREACKDPEEYDDGTYELVGPKINGNPEGVEQHFLVRHGFERLDYCNLPKLPEVRGDTSVMYKEGLRVTPDPRTFDEVRSFLENAPIEGIVWHHLDGRMVKIKKRDFGFNR